MIDSEVVLTEVRQALRGEPRLDFDHQSIRLAFAAGELLMSGEVDSIAAKKRAVARAATVPSVSSVIDELCVRPKAKMADGEIRDLLRKALIGEPTLAGCTVREGVRGGFRTLRTPLTVVGRIDFKVRQGVITLEGEVPSLFQKRLPGVLSWQIPGTRNVIDELAVQPAEDDSDELIADAVRQALDKDPLVHAAGIRVNAQDRLVTLEGAVPAVAERDEAERDAWCVIGVDDVLNRLAVRA
jgi:osmotically-inducible protein OsmY